jgi:isopenicillin-N N-acyltransferase-like protein
VSGSSTAVADMEVITCAGTPRQRGEQHGEALRHQIADGLARWSEAIATAHGVNADTYIDEFVHGTDFLSAIRRWTPKLLEEVQGIARGSGQPWEWIYACNLLDEEWTWASAHRRGHPPGCTMVGIVPQDGPPLLAQTMDINRFHDGAQAVIRLEGDVDPDVLVFTRAGMIGLTGCNAAGLAVVVNNLDVLPASRTGLPVAFAIRGILERRSLGDATAFFSEMTHATGQHYGLASPEGLASVEAWATGVTVNTEPGARLVHTNHPLSTEPIADDAEERFKLSRTRERLDFVERGSRACHDASGIQKMLSDRTVPISLDAMSPSMTFGAVVYECSVPAKMRIALGPPHLQPFHAVHLSI